MKRLCFLPLLLLFSLYSIAQSTGQIEKSLPGMWRLARTTELSVPDSLYSKLQSEEVQYMIFDEKGEAFIRFSSVNENQYYQGNYKVNHDKKSNASLIRLKSSFGSCGEKSVEIVSLTDTTLTIRSCRNPIDLVFVKEPLPKAKIEQVKTTLQGLWEHAETEHSCAIADSIKEIPIRYDNVTSFQFYPDSVEIRFNNNHQPIIAEYFISYEVRFDVFSLKIPALSQKRCSLEGASFTGITKERMVLTLCDCDFSRVIFEKHP